MARALKSFTLYTPRRIPVTRFAVEYSAEEQLRFRELFRPIAQRHRFRTRIATIVLIVGFACIVAGFFLPAHLSGWIVGGFLICWLVLMVLVISTARLQCPACSNDMERSFGQCCPECGGRALQPGGWLRAPHCNACGKSMWRSKARRYTIRACTHCGLLLDEKGL